MLDAAEQIHRLEPGQRAKGGSPFPGKLLGAWSWGDVSPFLVTPWCLAGYVIDHFDVKTAFLYAPVPDEEEMYLLSLS